ncbi:MAG: PD40 domain-containing protein, partial [Deltaproteobacteria bacterium]|nr:PD40 domain-containing protein [Deltaproteobacteria bacterium]
MKIQHYILMLAIVLCFLVLSPLESGAYPFLKEVGKGGGADTVLEVGAMPALTPSRRQFRDADKGDVCLKCHRMPYPTAPQMPKKRGDKPLSSIQTSPPGGLRLLISLSTPLSQVAGGWSPDGKKIVYSVNLFKDDWDIWVMDADGKNRQSLISGTAVEMAPDWGQDGRAILFQSNHAGNNDIWMMDIASGKKTLCTTDPGEDTMPKWSPDGKKIVFQSNRSGDEEIWLMDIITRGLTQLTRNPAKDENPVFSPLGGKIVFVSDRSGNKDIYVMNPDGSGQKAITHDPEEEIGLHWGPDGEKIIFSRKTGDNWDLWAMNSNGSDRVRLTTHPAAELGPYWSPDGKWVIFTSTIRGHFDMLLMQVDASMVDPPRSVLRRLTDSEAREVGTVWSPDGKKIAYNSDVNKH